MDETVLLRLALTGAIVGLVSLFFVSLLSKPNNKEIGQLETGDVRFTGVVADLTDKEKVAYLTLAQPVYTKVIVFKNQQLKLAKGDFVVVSGELREYEGKHEIIADTIEKLE
ncbi:MAG: OB-fold nucleic acid binding domain-containing protein [Candidatus Woesearchaeota archaeon]